MTRKLLKRKLSHFHFKSVEDFDYQEIAHIQINRRIVKIMQLCCLGVYLEKIKWENNPHHPKILRFKRDICFAYNVIDNITELL